MGSPRYQTTIPLDRYSLVLTSDSEKIVEAVSSWVDRDIAARHDACATGRKKPIRVELHTSHHPKRGGLPFPLRPTGAFEDVEFFADDEQTTLIFGGSSSVTADLRKGEATGFVSPEHAESPWIISHRIFYVPILEMLRSAGAFYIHAGCVCAGDRCVLLCGGSGHGKSTLTYALARSRFSYLSDDAVFIQGSGERIEIFSFPEKIKLDGASRSFFPELGRLEGSSGKVEIPSRLTGIKDISVRGEPYALIFVEIAEGTASRLAPVEKSDALLRLIRQSVSITSKKSMGAQLDLLKRLVETSKCYEMKAGRDLDRAPALVEKVLFER